VGHVVHSGASGVRNVDTLYFFLGWDRYGCHKKCPGTHYAKLVSLHTVGSASHIVHFGAAGARNLDTPFFMLGSARCSFHKKRTKTRYAELMFLPPVGSAGHIVHSHASGHEISMHYFLCSCGPYVVSIKSTPGHVTPNLCFCIRWNLWVT
jgi:hypothetical protein